MPSRSYFVPFAPRLPLSALCLLFSTFIPGPPMNVPPIRVRIPLAVQVGAVALLFAAASATLWITSTRVVARESRRALARRHLAETCQALVDRAGAARLAGNPWPLLAEPTDQEADARALETTSAAVLDGSADVRGGYFQDNGRRFVPDFPAQTAADSRDLGLDDLVETQAHAAIRKRRIVSVVEDLGEGVAVAVQAAPVLDRKGDVAAAAWTMTRLADPLFRDRSAPGYSAAAGLALGGIALSMVLTINLARTVRRQALDRERLQTDMRRVERLAALGKLLAGVAHEVRNPLAGIRSTAQLWRRGIGRDEESIDALTDEVDRLEGIVSRLLQFSRADAQDLAPGDLNSVVLEAARLARPAAEAKGVRLDLDLAPELPPAAMAPPALMQVFRNLTTNALQAMPGGGILRLSTRLDASSHSVEALVADTGPGLPPEALRHLFEPFFTTKPEGTGLGLAIAREIALAHRGDLRASNRADRTGAEFALRLPIANGDVTEMGR